MPSNKDWEEDYPEVENLTDDMLQLRFSDAMKVVIGEDNIIISNSRTNDSKAFSKKLEPILNLFMDWVEVSSCVEKLLTDKGDQSIINKLIEILYQLLQLDVLDTRKADLSGSRLPDPGLGWRVAMRFLLETRTKKDTVYAIPTEFYTALAEKALICRQPSAFYERVGVKFHPLSDPRISESDNSTSFEDVLLQRRTARRFSSQQLSEIHVSKLLFYGWGMTGSVDNPLGDVFVRKTSPSGGSLHPVEVYPIILNVEGIPKGLYHYSVRRHGLEEISIEDPSDWIVEACGDQEWVIEAGVIFLCTAFLPRTAWKYDYSRVVRAVISEIGYSGQSAFLTATWLGLGAFTTLALRDEIFEKKFGLDPMREPVFSVTGAGHLERNVENFARPRKESALGVPTS